MLSAEEIIRRYQVIIGHLGNGGEKNHAFSPPQPKGNVMPLPVSACFSLTRDAYAPLGCLFRFLWKKSAF